MVKNFPLSWLLAAPFAAVMRYGWHVISMLNGTGKAAEFRDAGEPAWRLAWFVVKAHLALLIALPRLLSQRWAVPRRISSREMCALLKRHSVALREVAAH